MVCSGACLAARLALSTVGGASPGPWRPLRLGAERCKGLYSKRGEEERATSLFKHLHLDRAVGPAGVLLVLFPGCFLGVCCA